MWFETMQAERIDLAVKRINHSATLSDQRGFNGKLNQNNKKLKQRCLLQIEHFFDQNKKTYQIKPLFDQKKTWRLYIWNLMTNLAN